MKHWPLVIAVVLLPGTAIAQEPVQSWSGLKTEGWSTVYVADDKGAEIAGRFLRIAPDALTLRVGNDERRIEAARIRRIQTRGDSLRNGLIAGAVVGVAIGLLAGGIADCPGDDPSGDCPGFRVAAVAGATATYAAIGAGIDFLVVGRTTVYEMRTTKSGSAAPSLGGRVAFNLRLRW